MKTKMILGCIAFACIASSTLFTSCSKKASTTTTTNPTAISTLDVNTWTVDGVPYKLSLYGAGWASTDFAPRYGLTDYTTNSSFNESIEMNFAQQPTTSGNYTIEEYSKVHLKQITGNFVGLEIGHNNEYYKSTSTTGIAVLNVSGKEIEIAVKDAILKNINNATTVKVSGHMKCTWK